MKQVNNLLVIIGLAVLVGCASFQATSGKLLASTAATVDATMKGWATYVVANKVPDDQQTQVKDAYGKYQLAMGIAQRAYAVALTSGDQSGWTTAEQALTTNANALTALIASFSTIK